MHKIHPKIDPSYTQAHLTNSCILQAEGADAATFLQGQFSQDIGKLQNTQACFAGLSNPKGRLIASSYIYRKADDCFWLILPTSMLTETQKQLGKYVMRSKVKFSVREDVHLYGLSNPQTENLNLFTDVIKLAEHANLYFAITEEKISSDLQDETHWTLQKILNIIPEVTAETQEQFVAQMLNMDVLDGISFNKGCYTGQEVIARMQHLGRVKRRSLLLETGKLYQPGEKILHADKAIGQVVNSIATDEQAYALAVMQLDKLKEINNENLLQNSGLKIFEPTYALEQKV